VNQGTKSSFFIYGGSGLLLLGEYVRWNGKRNASLLKARAGALVGAIAFVMIAVGSLLLWDIVRVVVGSEIH
jgi:hypothetical protein